jgi:TRAP transporter 4TM/12TM fusion protein
MMVHLEAKKLNLSGVPRSELPPLRSTLAKAWVFVIPIVILLYFMAMGYGLATSAMNSIITLFVLSMTKKETRCSPLSLLRAFERAANMAVPVGIAMACAGLIIGTFYLSGLGDVLASLIVTIAGNNLYIGLIATAIVCLILGLGIPTTIVYVMVYMFAIPAMIKMGANPLAANLFAFYFGIISTVTPPVALTAFAAAAVAESPMMRTGFTASRLAIAGYIVPFLFILAPSLVLQGPILNTILNFCTALIGLFCVSVALEGWFLGRKNWTERTLYLIAGLCLIMPQPMASVAGIVLFAVLIAEQKLRMKRAVRQQMDIARCTDGSQR